MLPFFTDGDLGCRCRSGTTRLPCRNGASRRASVRDRVIQRIYDAFLKGYLRTDDSTPLGPVLVSATAIPDPQQVALKTIVNGRTLQDGNTA